jgi:hypothetical protein
MQTIKNAFRRIRAEFEANPMLVLMILAGVLTAAAKFIGALSAAQNSRTWRKEVNRRVKNSK